MRSLIIFSLCFFSTGAVLAFTVKTSPEGDLRHWPEGDTAIFYVVGSAGEGSCSETVAALCRAFSVWEKSSGGDIKFIFQGRSEQESAQKDGSNVLVWVEEGWNYGTEAVAVSTSWYSPETGLIEEVDIEFNACDWSWSADEAEEGLSIETVTLHEVGHLLGIDHSFNPGAVMHETFVPQGPLRKVLSGDDLEALQFLYPPASCRIAVCDLPVLFSPDDFPGEKSFRLLPAVSSGAFSRALVLGSGDADRDGFFSELVSAAVDEAGDYSLVAGGIPRPWSGEFSPSIFRRRIAGKGEITGVAGIDIDRDGSVGEVAVLTRTGPNEMVYFYDAVPDAGASYEHLASCALAAPPANNVIGMTSPAAGKEKGADELVILRAVREGYSLYIYQIPQLWESTRNLRSGVELRLPGMSEGAKLLGLAALDTEGGGEREDLVVLEKTLSGELWVHAFRLSGDRDSSYVLSYLNSARLPEMEGNLRPLRMTGLDFNRDGLRDELILFSREK